MSELPMLQVSLAPTPLIATQRASRLYVSAPVGTSMPGRCLSPPCTVPHRQTLLRLMHMLPVTIAERGNAIWKSEIGLNGSQPWARSRHPSSAEWPCRVGANIRYRAAVSAVRTSSLGPVAPIAPCLCASASLFLVLTAVIVPGMQPEHFERPLNDDPSRHVLVTHGLLREKPSHERQARSRRSISNQHRAHGVIATAV